MLRFLTLAGLFLRVANVRGKLRATFIRLIVVAVGLVFIIAAIVFGLVAGFIALSPWLGAIGAASAIAGLLLVIGLLFLLVSGALRRRQVRSIDPGDAAGLEQQYARVGQALGTGTPLTNPIVILAGAALLGGYLMGRRRKKGN